MNDKRFHEFFSQIAWPVAIFFYVVSYLSIKVHFHQWWVFTLLATFPAILALAYHDGYRGEQVHREQQILEELAHMERQSRRKR